jgi:hypothetical protein
MLSYKRGYVAHRTTATNALSNSGFEQKTPSSSTPRFVQAQLLLSRHGGWRTGRIGLIEHSALSMSVMSAAATTTAAVMSVML